MFSAPSGRSGEERATLSEIALASSTCPSCCNARASSKYPTSVGCTAAAREYRRMASARSPFSWAIKPSPTMALARSGCQLQRRLETLLCLHRLPQSAIGKSQTAIGCRAHTHVARVTSHQLVTFDGRWQIAAAILVGAKVQVGGQPVGTDGKCGAEVRGGLFGFALVEQKVPQIILSDVVVLGQRHRAPPESTGCRASSQPDGRERVPNTSRQEAAGMASHRMPN